MDEGLAIPIPHYPPFKLRSSLIDKDPVIWVHLLEAYIKLFKYLLSQEENGTRVLSIKSQQQLQLFLKVFLAETSQESTQIFSLGAINPDIKANTYTLKVYVFQFIRNFSLVKLNLPGEAIWDFISIYGAGNPSIVRGLVDGSYTSKFNDNKKSGKISCIGLVQKHIQDSVLNGKFSKTDMSNLSLLLGQHTTTSTVSVSGTSSSAIVNKKGSNALGFAEGFVNSNWVEILEKLYANGKGVNSSTSKELMVLSLISLTVAKIAKLATELGINSVKMLQVSPLFSSVIISEPFEELMPGLEERLQFLRNITFKTGNDYYETDHADGAEHPIDDQLPTDDQTSYLSEIFPDLTKGKAITILLENNNNVESVTNILLETPDIIPAIQEYKPPVKKKTEKKKPSKSLIDRFSNVGFEKESLVRNKKRSNSIDLPSNEAKEKILSATLRMMYDSDEDEPDDTYDDQVASTGNEGGGDSSSNQRNNRSGNKLTVYGDEDDEADALGNSNPRPLSAEKPPPSSAISPRERFLFGIFKTQGADLFAKSSRNTEKRGYLKKETSWSDEQIEGWFRMLSKSPKTFKVLEEDYFWSGNLNKKNLNVASSGKSSKSSSPRPAPSKDQSKRSQARNEKNKASRANHSRKTGHSKKTKGDLAGLQ